MPHTRSSVDSDGRGHTMQSPSQTPGVQSDALAQPASHSFWYVLCWSLHTGNSSVGQLHVTFLIPMGQLGQHSPFLTTGDPPTGHCDTSGHALPRSAHTIRLASHRHEVQASISCVWPSCNCPRAPHESPVFGINCPSTGSPSVLPSESLLIWPSGLPSSSARSSEYS